MQQKEARKRPPPCLLVACPGLTVLLSCGSAMHRAFWLGGEHAHFHAPSASQARSADSRSAIFRSRRGELREPCVPARSRSSSALRIQHEVQPCLARLERIPRRAATSGRACFVSPASCRHWCVDVDAAPGIPASVAGSVTEERAETLAGVPVRIPGGVGGKGRGIRARSAGAPYRTK